MAIIAGVLLASSQLYAKPFFGFKYDGSLDKDAISKYYFEGDFSRILPPLEQYRQSFPKHATREDSIFVFKYLSVIYAADSTTRKKAESFMIQLIKLMPTIELLDLYISDNIQAIFNNVKVEFEHQQKYVRNHDLYGRVMDSTGKGPAPDEKPGKKSSKAWIGWTAAGVGVAAIAGTTIYLMSDEKEPDTYRLKP